MTCEWKDITKLTEQSQEQRNTVTENPQHLAQ